MGPASESQSTDQVDRIGLATGTEVGRFVLIEIHGQLQADVHQRPHLVERPDAACSPEVDP